MLEPHGGFGQTACPLVELLLRCLHKALPIASVGDALSELFLLLKKISRRVQARVNVSYLVRSARHWTVDRKRQEGVRPRCGSCQHYGWMARTCLHQGNPHVGLLISPSMNPADLQPPCEWFRSRKETLGAGDDVLRSTSHVTTELDRLVAGLDRLRSTDAAAEALLVLVFFEGYSQRDLARMIPCSRRRVAAEVKLALAKLGRILEDLS